jgi:hypothetical protein
MVQNILTATTPAGKTHRGQLRAMREDMIGYLEHLAQLKTVLFSLRRGRCIVARSTFPTHFVVFPNSVLSGLKSRLLRPLNE